MYFSSWNDFVAMGGHGLYVWLSYGFFLIVIIWNLLMPVIQRSHVLKSTARYWRRRQSEVQSGVSESHLASRDGVNLD